jgi:hypothetical protein
VQSWSSDDYLSKNSQPTPRKFAKRKPIEELTEEELNAWLELVARRRTGFAAGN